MVSTTTPQLVLAGDGDAIFVVIMIAFAAISQVVKLVRRTAAKREEGRTGHPQTQGNTSNAQDELQDFLQRLSGEAQQAEPTRAVAPPPPPQRQAQNPQRVRVVRQQTPQPAPPAPAVAPPPPVPAIEPEPSEQTSTVKPSFDITSRLSRLNPLQQSIVLREILGPPKAIQP